MPRPHMCTQTITHTHTHIKFFIHVLAKRDKHNLTCPIISFLTLWDDFILFFLFLFLRSGQMVSRLAVRSGTSLYCSRATGAANCPQLPGEADIFILQEQIV